MEELKMILLTHAGRYPLMEPTDAVKLIYQNEFGGGHLIKDEGACLAYLRREYEGLESDPAVPLYEPIGNGIVRVNLAALPPEDLEPLGQAFLRSAAAHRGTPESFLRKLRVLEQLTRDGYFSFSSEDLAAYLFAYKAAGCPPVSHSGVYRKAYRPAYRVIRKENAPRPPHLCGGVDS